MNIFNLFVYRWTFGLFLPLAIVNNASMDIYVHFCLNICLQFFGYITGNGINRSNDNFTLNLLTKMPARCWWLMPVILATQEAEIRRIAV
jgi:hypothetical protein